MGDIIEPSDYGNTDNWLYLPDSTEKCVDVFYVYPTAWMRTGDVEPFCPITHTGMRRGAETVFSVQATAFFPVGNVYAPFYRQFDPYFLLTMPAGEQRRYIGGVPKTDITAAFDYYIRNLSGGRPFILLSHSQGSATVKELLFDYMKSNPEVYKRMIAAYVTGYAVTKGELSLYPHLKFAENADDSGVIISYNTEKPGCTGENATVLPEALVINPIIWTTEETPAGAELNLGSLITGGGRLEIKKNFADATVCKERGTLLCSTVSPEKYGTPPPLGTFHSGDISFYYCNLRQNALNRVSKYFDTKLIEITD